MNLPVKNQKIVVVDDEKNNAELLETYLGDKGFDVDVAFTGKDGLRKIIEIQPDLVILDLFLPDIMGSEICAHLQTNKLTRKIPVIMCTAKSISHEEKMKGFAAGVSDYLIRPFPLEELLARIRAILRRIENNETPDFDPFEETPNAASSVDSADESQANNSEPSTIAEPTPPANKKPQLLERWWKILNHPRSVLQSIRSHEDFFMAVLMVLTTPLIFSLTQMTEPGADFDAWIGYFSLGLITHLLAWFGIAGVLHMVVPFLGGNLPMRQALIFSGFSWAPRLLGSLFAGFYGVVALTGWIPESGNFSAGFDIVPGLAAAKWIGILAPFNVFNLWATLIVLLGFWTIGNSQKKWNVLTFFVGGTCLLFGFIARA